MTPDRTNWIRRTGQRWKVRILFGWVYVAFGLGVVDYLTGYRNSLLAVSGVLFVLWIPWLLWAIRCPACGRRPFSRLLRRISHQHWPAVYWTMQNCPECGNDARTA